MSTVLAPRDAILSQFDKLVAESRVVAAAAMKAPDILDENGRVFERCPDGMSVREFNIAQAALLPAKNAPLYLTEAFRTQETAIKVAAGLGGDSAPKLVQHVVHVVEARQYERVKVKTIDVDAKVVDEKPKE